MCRTGAEAVILRGRNCFQFQASVGVAPSTWDRIRAGELVEVNGRAIRATGPGFTLVRSSALKEVSIVAIGADAGTSVAIAASRKGEEVFMTTNPEQTVDDIRAEAAAETERIHAIRLLCAGQFGEIEARAIRDGWDAQRTELAVLRAGRPQAPAIQSRGAAPTRHVLETAILAHMGHETLATSRCSPRGMLPCPPSALSPLFSVRPAVSTCGVAAVTAKPLRNPRLAD